MEIDFEIFYARKNGQTAVIYIGIKTLVFAIEP
jgi:hypothetical protein